MLSQFKNLKSGDRKNNTFYLQAFIRVTSLSYKISKPLNNHRKVIGVEKK